MRHPLASAVLLAAAMLLVAVAPAAAWDPDETEPIGVPVDPPPFELPDMEPVAPPAGIYLVTDAYAGDYVSHEGTVTTYGTATVHGPTDSYARVIDTVATGADSIFDGTAFNGRSSLTDGRLVAGAYYENFFLTAAGFVSFGIVFFQDDAETARSGAPAAAPPVVPGPTVASPGPVGAVVPQVEPPAPRTVAGPPVVARVEVLRGRRIEIWLGGLPAGAVWHFAGGEAVVLGPREGGAGDPFVARWDRLAAPGAAWTVSFEITAGATATRTLAIEVAVRSPGLVE